MPISTPKPGEEHDEFMERCHSEMHDEMPDDAQRSAVCEKQWQEEEGSSALAGLKYGRIVRYVRETPWAILPGTLATILDLLSFRALGGRLSAEEIQQRIGAATRPAMAQAGMIAVLPLFGVIAHRMGSITEASGGTSVERFSLQLRALLADAQVGAVVVDIDSPGGAVNGIDELSAEIYRARAVKPILAISNSLAASAAYWVGTAASELSVIPTGEVGSIGVLAAHQNISGQMEREGIQTTLISAGKYKAEGSPFEALSEEARENVQQRVNEYYGMFVKAVARNRGVPVETVRSGFGEGRVVGARTALSLGMVDHVETMEELLARLGKQLRPGRAGAVARTIDVAVDTAGNLIELAAGPLPPHKSPAIAPDDAPWDGPGEVAKAEGAAELRRMHAWVDSEGDPDAKSSYKLPHHRADGTLVPKGCTAVMGAMHGGRGGVDIPDADRPGVNRHMERHYDEMGKEMPGMPEGAAAALSVDARRRLRLAGA